MVRTMHPRAYEFWTQNFSIREAPSIDSFNLALDIFSEGRVKRAIEIKGDSIDFQMFRLLLMKSPYKELFATKQGATAGPAPSNMSPEEKILYKLRESNMGAHRFWMENFLGPDPVDASLFLMALDSAGKGKCARAIQNMHLKVVDLKLFNILLNGPLALSFIE